VDIALPRVAHVTNARTGEALGETARLRTTLTAGDALVLTLGPERTPLRLETPVRTKRGPRPPSRPPRRPRPAAPPLARVRADGAFRPEYARVTVEDGPSAAFALPSALNDPAGEYRIRVTDVLSGASAETTLRLE